MYIQFIYQPYSVTQPKLCLIVNKETKKVKNYNKVIQDAYKSGSLGDYFEKVKFDRGEFCTNKLYGDTLIAKYWTLKQKHGKYYVVVAGNNIKLKDSEVLDIRRLHPRAYLILRDFSTYTDIKGRELDKHKIFHDVLQGVAYYN